jgi:glycine/D-amino acid oxidase-like deaminating enzyme
MRRAARSLHVAVVGGGVVGVSTADELLRRGCEVTLLEATQEVAGVSSATWGNAGTLWKSLRGTTPCEPATLWRTLKLLGRDPGHEKNVFINNSCLTDAAFYRWALALARCSNPSDYDWRAAHGDAQRYLMERAAALDAGGLRVAGGEVRSAGGAVLSSDPGDALGDSALYAKALAADCKARGLHVWTNAPAEAVDGGGVTVDGARVDADAVVLCAGARAASLLPFYVPIHPLRGYSITARVTDSKRAPSASFFVEPEHLYCTRLDATRIRFTCYGEFVPLSGWTPPTRALQERLKRLIAHAVPHASEWSDFVDCEVWHGDRPLTPDGLPLVGKLAPGLYINAGHGFNGWRDAGITASFVAGLVAGGDVDAPAYVEAWAPARFNL